MAQKEEPNIELILPDDFMTSGINSGVQCKNYGTGCVKGKKAKIRKVVITVVEFDTAENARTSAKIIDQYYSRNWVFDDVTGEPVLESFVKKVFNAKRPALDDQKK